MVDFFVIHPDGERFLRKSTDEFGEVLYEPVNDDGNDSSTLENYVRAKIFHEYGDVDTFIGDKMFVMKVKGYRQVFHHPAYIFEESEPFRFLCPNSKSEINLPQDNQFSVFWELSKKQEIPLI